MNEWPGAFAPGIITGQEAHVGEFDLSRPPKTSDTEVAWTPAKIKFSLLPGLSTGAQFLDVILSPLFNKRKEEWLEYLGRSVKDLIMKVDGLTDELLSQKDSFVTTAAHASIAAMRTHQQEKLKALRNAVLNTALPGAPSDDLQLLFLDAIDSLTPSHLRLLAFFRNPREWAAKRGIQLPDATCTNMTLPSSVSAVLEAAMPEMRNQRDLYSLLYNNLVSHGFLIGDANAIGIITTAQGAVAARTTYLGTQFIDFITTPPVLDEGDTSQGNTPT